MDKSNILKSTSINGCDCHFLKSIEFPELNSLAENTRDLLYAAPNDAAGRVRFDLKSSPRDYMRRLEIGRIKCFLSTYFEEPTVPDTWSYQTRHEYECLFKFGHQIVLPNAANRFIRELTQVNVYLTESMGGLREAQWVASEGNGKVRFIYPDPEVSPHFPVPDQQLTAVSGGSKCAHGAVFKATKPYEDC